MDYNTLVNNCHSKVGLTLTTRIIWWDPIGVELATNLEGGFVNVIQIYEHVHLDDIDDYDVKGCGCVYV